MPKSAFAAWFKEQYGKLPNEAKRQRLVARRMDVRCEWVNLNLKIEEEEILQTAWIESLKGWCARDKPKRKSPRQR